MCHVLAKVRRGGFVDSLSTLPKQMGPEGRSDHLSIKYLAGSSPPTELVV